MWLFGTTLCLLFVVIAAKEVTIPDLGTVEGTTTLSAWTNRTIYQYQGIPYAQPPVWSLRFKPPEPFRGRWNTTFNATDFGPICLQHKGIPASKGRMDEDCLYVNVYTPKTEGGGEGRGLPVLVYIHGGSFHIGTARNILPNHLLEEDIVLVAPQYRLGPLGFLSLKTEDVPGNQGMLDVIFALEWIHTNIEYFGGDPKRITLFGQSAGGAAVTLMLFSPLVRNDLFQRVIIAGGSILGKWGLDSDPIEHARMLASRVNCTQIDRGELAHCLRQKSSDELLQAHDHFMDLGVSIGHQVVWNENGNRSFLTDDPHVLLRQGKIKSVPMLAGVTKHEGSFIVALLFDQFIAPNEALQWHPISRDFVQMAMERIGISDKTGFVTNIVAESYFKEDDYKDLKKIILGFIDISGSTVMKSGVLTMVKAMSRQTRSFLYSFNYFNSLNQSCYGNFSIYGRDRNTPWNYPFPGGIAHGDELLYLFPQEYAVLTGRDKIMAKKMTQIFTSFVKNGTPSAEGFPTWPSFSSETGPYLKVDENPSVHENFIDEFFIAVKEGLTPISRRQAEVDATST